ncbi:hypothetical protein SSX86_015847 [Deinandra increscens subsp. villosa]|uniref:Senescence domain-containing protein n=1 Tax=Deinandra increscens subsp. villosa TaxID=3103831 RepID=A0AAP0CWT7_9ASTR
MESQNPRNLYPKVLQSNPDSTSPYSYPSSSSSTLPTPSAPSLYPSLDIHDLNEDLFAGDPHLQTSEEVVVKIPGSIVHLIDKQQSIELASGALEIVRLRQGDAVVAVLARVGDAIQWPLAKDEAAVKLDGSHYFFTLRVPSGANSESESESDNLLNYGLTVTGKRLGKVLEAFDRVLDEYSAFSVKEVERSVTATAAAAGEESGGAAEEKAAAYWTTLAPNVEDYSGSVARLIAGGSGKLIKGILWCGDVTVERLKWGNEVIEEEDEMWGEI